MGSGDVGGGDCWLGGGDSARETRRGGDSEVISSEGSLTLLMLAGSIVARGSVEAGNHFSLFFAGR